MTTELLRAKRKIRLLKQALKIFMELDWGAWEGRVHEEGCPGVDLRKKERGEDEECFCDGDWDASVIKKAMR